MSAAASVDEVLQQALEGTGLPTFPNVYTGGLLKYLVWTYTEIPAVFADGAPHAARYLVNVRYYMPHKQDPSGMKQVIRRALFTAGCTWPSILPISDSEGQAYVFECEYTDGGGWYGAGNP